MRRSAEGLTFVEAPSGIASKPQEGSLLVFLIGDALIEPFWPEGLGIARGFFGVLDASFCIGQWANGHSEAAVIQTYTEAYSVLKTLNASCRSVILQSDEQRFALAPCTRYRPHATSRCITGDDLRVRDGTTSSFS